MSKKGLFKRICDYITCADDDDYCSDTKTMSDALSVIIAQDEEKDKLEIENKELETKNNSLMDEIKKEISIGLHIEKEIGQLRNKMKG